MRHHLRFKNIRGEVVRAAETLFEARPHSLEGDAQREAVERFLVAVSDAYSVSTPQVDLSGSVGYGRRRRGVRYQPAHRDALGDESQAAKIVMSRFSMLNLFRGTRQHLLANGQQARGTDDPLGWACSLYYLVKPVTFRKIARMGRVPGVNARDTYSAETWNRMRGVNVVDQWDRLQVENFDPRDLDAIEAGDLDPFGGLDEAVEAAATIVEQNVVDEAEAIANDNVSCPDCEGHGYVEGDEGEADAEPEECEFCEGNGVVARSKVEARNAPQVEDLQVSEDGAAQQTVVPTMVATGEGDDGLDALGIVALRRLGSGQGIQGMWELGTTELRAALRERGIRPPQ